MKLYLLSDLARTLDHLRDALQWAERQVNRLRVWVWTRQNIAILKDCNDRQAARTRFC